LVSKSSCQRKTSCRSWRREISFYSDETVCCQCISATFIVQFYFTTIDNLFIIKSFANLCLFIVVVVLRNKIP